MEDNKSQFPTTVFVKNLPEEFTFTEVAEVASKYGEITEMKRLDDNDLLIQFQTSKGAKDFSDASSEKTKRKHKPKIRENYIRVIPKRSRYKTS